MCNKTTISQFGTHTVKIEHNNKHKVCRGVGLSPTQHYSFLCLFASKEYSFIYIRCVDICSTGKWASFIGHA